MQDLLTADESLAEGFRRVRFFVMDEADRLLEPSFESELRIIAGALPRQRQTLLFSATLTRSLAMLQSSSLRDAHIFQVSVSALQAACEVFHGRSPWGGPGAALGAAVVMQIYTLQPSLA